MLKEINILDYKITGNYVRNTHYGPLKIIEVYSDRFILDQTEFFKLGYILKYCNYLPNKDN